MKFWTRANPPIIHSPSLGNPVHIYSIYTHTHLKGDKWMYRMYAETKYYCFSACVTRPVWAIDRD